MFCPTEAGAEYQNVSGVGLFRVSWASVETVDGIIAAACGEHACMQTLRCDRELDRAMATAAIAHCRCQQHLRHRCGVATECGMQSVTLGGVNSRNAAAEGNHGVNVFWRDPGLVQSLVDCIANELGACANAGPVVNGLCCTCAQDVREQRLASGGRVLGVFGHHQPAAFAEHCSICILVKGKDGAFGPPASIGQPTGLYLSMKGEHVHSAFGATR